MDETRLPPEPTRAGAFVDAPRPVTVAVPNDYHLVVAGIAGLLEPYADRVEVVEIASSAPVRSDVEVVLFDTFAQAQGASLPAVELRTSSPDARRVVFTWATSRSLVDQTRDAGADGMISKRASAAELVEVLGRIYLDERVFPEPEPEPSPESDPIGRWPGDDHGLSVRESEVLALICQGLGNQEIADRAYLGLNTVKTYIRTAYRKIGVTSRVRAVIWGLAHGFGPDRVSRRLPPHRGD